MTTETVLTDADIHDKYKRITGYRSTPPVVLDFARAIEQAVLQSPDIQALRKDAELGRTAMRFVDRAGDYCKEDPAERICDQFHGAMADVVDRHYAMEQKP